MKKNCYFTCHCTGNICQYRIYSKEFFNDNLFSALAFSVKILLAGTCTVWTISSKAKINYCLRQKFRMISYFEEASVAWKLCEVEQSFKSSGQSLPVQQPWQLSGMKYEFDFYTEVDFNEHLKRFCSPKL